MPLFRKPQEKKGSAIRAGAQEGKRALSGSKKSGFRLPFFGKKEAEEKQPHDKEVQQKPTEEKQPEVEAPAIERFGSASRVILQPRVTEKGSDVAAKAGAYAFDVHPDATKPQIAQGIKELYGVDPLKVRVARVPHKRVRGRRGQEGVKSGGKKAYVYLKEGDSIEFV